MTELGYLLNFIKPIDGDFLAGIFFVVVSNIFALYPAIFTGKAFDTAKKCH